MTTTYENEISRLQFGERMALDMMIHNGCTVAEEPAVIFADDAAHYQDQLNVPIQDIAAYYEEALDIPGKLSHMAVALTAEGSKYDHGLLQALPAASPDTGKLHYPIVRLTVPPAKRECAVPLPVLNHTLGHEMGHVLQPNRASFWFENEKVLRVVQAISYVGAGAAALGGVKMALEGSMTASGGFMAMAAATPLLGAKETVITLLHSFDRDEIQANRFASKHRKFQPITAA